MLKDIWNSMILVGIYGRELRMGNWEWAVGVGCS
jgi:hypothetical protein